jgi:hypothetical protein
LFDFDVAKANELKIKTYDQETTLKRDDENKWMIVQPEGKILKGNIADNILLTLISLEADSIVEYASDNLSIYELEEPQFRVTVGLENSQNSMLVGKKTESYYFVMNEALSYVYLVRKNKLEELMSIAQSLVEQ